MDSHLRSHRSLMSASSQLAHGCLVLQVLEAMKAEFISLLAQVAQDQASQSLDYNTPQHHHTAALGCSTWNQIRFSPRSHSIDRNMSHECTEW